MDLIFNGTLETICLEGLGSRFKLKVLRLCCAVSNADLIRVADTFPLLEEIRTQDCTPLGKVAAGPAVNDEGIHYLSSKLKRLCYVDIYHESISDNSLVSLASNCKCLEHFVLYINTKVGVLCRVTENGISFLAENCPHLKSLFISGFLKM